MSMAKVTLLGNVGRDPETRFTQDGTPNTTFTLAVSDRKKEWTNWYRVTAWRKQGEVIAAHVKKGDSLLVIGDLQQREFTGNDGQARVSLEVALSDFQFVGGKNKPDQENGQAPAAPPRQGRPKPALPTPQLEGDEEWTF